MIVLLCCAALAQPAPDLPDRSAPPAVEPAQPLVLPEPTEHVLRGGVLVHHLRVAGLRKARVQLMFRRGPLEIDGRDNPAFTAMAWIQDQATRRTSADELAVFEDVHDLDVWTQSGLQMTTAGLDAPLRTLDEGLGLLREVVTEPRFRRRDLRLLRESQLRQWIVEGPSRSDVVVSSALTYGWFPRDHPLGARPDVRGWQQARLRHLRERHRALLAQAPVDVMVVADMPWSELRPRLVRLLHGVGVEAPLPQPPPFSPPTQTRVIGVDFRGSDQASVALRLAAPPLEHEDSLAFRLLDFAVGGSFLSRLNARLREEQGLTYGIGSEYGLTLGRAHWSVRTQVANDNVSAALDGIEQVLAEVAVGGLSEAEVQDAIAGRISAWNATLTSVGSAAQTYGARLKNRKDGAWARGRLEGLRRTTPDDTRRAAERWVGADAPRLWVVVGDRERLSPQLSDRGWQVEWIPAELVVLGRL